MKVDENGSFSLDAGQKTWQVAKNMRRAWFVLFSGHSILPIWIVKKIHRMHLDPRNPKMKSKTHSMPSRSWEMSPSTFAYDLLRYRRSGAPSSNRTIDRSKCLFRQNECLYIEVWHSSAEICHTPHLPLKSWNNLGRPCGNDPTEPLLYPFLV